MTELDAESVTYTLTKKDIMKAWSAKGTIASGQLNEIMSSLGGDADILSELYCIANATLAMGSSVTSYIVDEDVYKFITGLAKLYKPKYNVKYKVLYTQQKEVRAGSKEEAEILVKTAVAAAGGTMPFHEIISIDIME